MEERTSMENEPAEPAEPGPVDRVDTVQLEAPPAPEWAAADAEGPESQPEDVAAPVSPALSASPVLPEPPAAVPRQRAATGGAAAEGDGGDREVDVARKAKSSEEVDGRQAKKARNKGVKKKKKVAYGATEEPEEEAEEDVRPNVIGCPSEAIKVEIYVWTGIKERKEESWQCKETGQKTFPMRVIDFETIPGHSLRKEDLPETALHQGREEDVWCHMIYDLSTDPLLKEIGHEGPTKFSALMLLYISYLEGEKSKHATEIRIAHIDHFEFAVKSLVYTNGTKDLRDCETRGEAMGALLSVVRAQAFQFPFRVLVREVEPEGRPGGKSPEEEEHQADSGEAQETEQEEHPEEEGMIMTVDLSRWKEGELTVADLNIDDHQSIRETLTAVEYMEEVMREKDVPPVKGSQEDPRKDLKAKMAELAFGLRALQRASLKHQLRSVGLAVLETEREVATSSASAVVWSQAYQHFGRQEAREGGELSPSAEPEEKPVQRVLLLSAPELILRRRAEVRKLRRRVLPNKVNEEFLGGFKMEQFDQKGPLQKYWVETPQSSYPYRPFFQPPAPAVDPAALLSPAERKFLTRSFITDPLSEILGPGGTVDPRQGGATLGCSKQVSPGGEAMELGNLRKFVQPIFGVCMSIWGTFFCIFWRRRCAWLSHSWGNGWIEETDGWK
eukprot:g17655.t1